MAEMSSVELSIKGDVERLHLGPDDKLVITLHEVHSELRFREIEEALMPLLQKMGISDRVLLIAGDQISLTVLEGANNG